MQPCSIPDDVAPVCVFQTLMHHVCAHCSEFCEELLATAGVRFAGPIAILRNWTYCLFYVMAELWGSVVVSVLFWGFANQITTVEEAEGFYPLFGLGANVALIFSGQAVTYFSMVSQARRERLSLPLSKSPPPVCLRIYRLVSTRRLMPAPLPRRSVPTCPPESTDGACPSTA